MGKTAMGNKPRKRKGKRELFGVVEIVVIVLCMVTTIGGGIGIFVGTRDYSKATAEYDRLGMLVELRDVNTVGDMDVSDQVYKIDWEKLRLINSEIVAWIMIPGTPVNYPVVQTDDNAKYLHLSFEGADNICGTIFMNTYNHSDFSDWNTILYGHNMKNGSMFATLNRYKNEDFYKEHQEIWILTPFWERKYKIISAHPAQDGSQTYAVEFPEGEYEQHVASEVTQSLYDTGNGYNVQMPMVTLSTCTGRGRLDRFVLICQPIYETKLNPFIRNAEPGESEGAIGSGAVLRESVAKSLEQQHEGGSVSENNSN